MTCANFLSVPFIRSRSRSYYERRHRSPTTSKSKISSINVSASDLEGKTPEEIEMMKTMGFCGFETTKGKKVDGNNVGEVHVILKRKYRYVCFLAIICSFKYFLFICSI